MTTLKNNFKRSHVIYLILFILILIAIRWSWHDHVSIPDPPKVEQGLLDLRGVTLENTSSFPIEGEWDFYPGQRIGNSNINEASRGQKIQVPGNWKDAPLHG
ncbi:hypothetical protein [Paenibacillus sp. NPDC057934]|uniref:hypothetical protein n=1 Tax=Paenibacillus sp. NPDC057934 TaxID=3346282 RepID=UPI0036DC9EF6